MGSLRMRNPYRGRCILEDIDFVVTWVDGNDPDWLREKRQWADKDRQEANNVGRYRDWKLLRYWFRAVETYAPWVHAVYLVTWGHVPAWLDRTCSKLRVVRHDEFIPAAYLPTFSSHPIEWNLHRLPGLSEHFVYFNDDTFLNAPVEPSLFFQHGLPCDFIQMNHIVFDKYRDKFNHLIANNEAVINENFTRDDLLHHFSKVVNAAYPLEDSLRNLMFLRHRYILNMKCAHLSISYRISDFERVWSRISDIVEETCRQKFRNQNDVTPWLIRSWRLMEGRFFPVNRRHLGRAFFLNASEDLSPILKALRSPLKMVCINDGYLDEKTFLSCQRSLTEELQTKLPDSGMFER